LPALNYTQFTPQYFRQFEKHFVAFISCPRLNLYPVDCEFFDQRLDVIDYHHFSDVPAQPRVVFDQLILFNDQVCLTKNIVKISAHFFDLTYHDLSILLAWHRKENNFVVLTEFVQKNIDVRPILQSFIVLVVVDYSVIQLDDQSIRFRWFL